MTRYCKKCGKKKTSYVVDPDFVEDFCEDCDDIPSGAEVSSLECFLNLITKKK